MGGRGGGGNHQTPTHVLQKTGYHHIFVSHLQQRKISVKKNNATHNMCINHVPNACTVLYI
jgi:hypothetical protein